MWLGFTSGERTTRLGEALAALQNHDIAKAGFGGNLNSEPALFMQEFGPIGLSRIRACHRDRRRRPISLGAVVAGNRLCLRSGDASREASGRETHRLASLDGAILSYGEVSRLRRIEVVAQD